MKRSIFNLNVKNDVLQRLNKLEENTTPHWGEMNPSQMLKHLQLTFGLGTGELNLGDRSTFFTRYVLRYSMLRPIIPSRKQLEKDPPMTFPEIDLMINTTIRPADFATEKENFITRLKEMDIKNRYSDMHPQIGKMKPADWGCYYYSHIHYHFTQFGI